MIHDPLHRADLRMVGQAVRQGSEQAYSYTCDDFALSLLHHSPFHTAPLDVAVPYRTEYLHILYITQGTAEVQLNMQPYALSAGTFLVVGAQSIYQVRHYSADLLGAALIVRPTLFPHLFPQAMPAFLCDMPIGWLQVLTPDEQDLYLSLLSSLLKATQAKSVQQTLTDSLLSAALHFTDGLYQGKSAQPTDRRQTITLQFLHLVQQQCLSHKRLAYYASQMALSKDHLSEVVRTYSDTTAQEWIEQAVLLEAQVRLRHTDKSIGAIAYELGFPNDSFFCKYFRRLTGLTPRTYRTQFNTSPVTAPYAPAASPPPPYTTKSAPPTPTNHTP